MSKSKPKKIGTLNFGTYTYTVHLHPEDLCAPDGKPVAGYCDSECREIHLAGNASERELCEVFVHEAFHAACYSMRVPLSYEQEEALASPLGLSLGRALEPWLKGKLRKAWRR